MLILADDKALAANVAMLLSERGLGGKDADLDARLSRWRSDRSARAEAARRTARGWIKALPRPPSGEGPGVGTVVALAFPDRVSKRRSSDGADWISVGGRGFRLDPTSPLARAEWLAVAETAGVAAAARIVSAAAITRADVESLFADRLETKRTVTFDPATGGVTALRETRLGAIRLASGPDGDADPAAVRQALIEGVRAHGLDLLPWNDGARSLRARAVFAGYDALSDDKLLADVDDWLGPLVERRLDRIAPGALTDALRTILGWDEQRAIDKAAPAEFISPAGTHHAIDYTADGGPRVELRVQALFGLSSHPTIGRGIPLVLSLTSPAGRPIQTTRDLPGFWAGSWADVAKDMRGRYPRHNWPDDPTAAVASLRTKNAQSRHQNRSS